MFLCLFLQIESPIISGGDAWWGERCSPGGHDVGNPDVPVWEEGKPPVPGKAATGELKAQENYKQSWGEAVKVMRAEKIENMRAKGECREWSQRR